MKPVASQQGCDAARCRLQMADIARLAGVSVSSRHHDEECLMSEGEFFAGDILLHRGEFQLAPVRPNHGMVRAASGCLVYVYIRGGAELPLLPAA